MADATPVPFDALRQPRRGLKRLARELVRDESRADDIEQEVWLRALRKPPRHRRSIRGWLATVMRNVAYDKSRARKVRSAPLDEPAFEEATAEQLAQRAETHERVTHAVLSLSEPYRSTVLFRYVGGRSLSSIAETQGVSIETVKSRLARARAKLRERLDRNHEGGRSAWMAALTPLLLPHGVFETATATGATAAQGWFASNGGALKVVAAAAVTVAVGFGVLSFARSGDDTTTTHSTTTEDGATTLAGTDRATPGLAGRAVPSGEPDGANANTEVDPAPGDVVAHADGISGRLLPATHAAPVAGILIGAREIGRPLGASEITTRTDGGGRFVLRGLNKARYILRVVHARNQRENGEGAVLLPHSWTGVESGSHGLQLAVRTGAVIEGRVVDDLGNAVTGNIEVHAHSAESRRVYRRTTTLDEEGRFRFVGVPKDGEYVLAGAHAAQPGERLDEGFANASARVAVGDAVVLTMPRGRRLDVTLADEDGTPVSVGSGVWLTSDHDPSARSAELLGNGRYTFGLVDQRRTYTVQTQIEGFLDAFAENTAPGGEAVTLTLQRSHSLHGQVHGLDASAVLYGIPVLAEAIDAPADALGTVEMVTTDREGRFSFTMLGPYRFRLRAGGQDSAFHPSGPPVRAVAGRGADVDLHVERGVRVSGSLKGYASLIRATSTDERHRGIEWTAPVRLGTFAFAGLPRGTIELSILSEGKRVVLGAIDTSSVSSAEVELTTPDDK